MSTNRIETDYLVVGAGAMGLAFADTLLDECDARILVVDRHGQPGGHWNDAYSFVRLHQPSAFYGVNSRALGSGRKDRTGLNRGLYEMASGREVLDHFGQVMDQRLLPSGRVGYLPMTSHEGAAGPGDQLLLTQPEGRRIHVRVRRKVVHATHTGTRVPSTHPPRYPVAPGARCVPPNALPALTRRYPRYTVVGSGKTGMDACLWLLLQGIEPASIRWVMPNDAWYIDRANVQPGEENVERFFEAMALQFECIAQAESLSHLFGLLETTGQLLRLDASVRPTKFRCATVTRAELAELRRIRDVVRLGRVRRIEPDRLVLDQGELDGLEDELYVDCSACGIPSRPGVPVFEGEEAIHLQLVRTCAPSFSAALIAAVECRIPGTEDRNALCQVVPLPCEDRSWLGMWVTSLENRQRWARHGSLMDWIAGSRLDYGARLREQVPPDLMQRYVAALKAAVPRMKPLLQAAAIVPRAQEVGIAAQVDGAKAPRAATAVSPRAVPPAPRPAPRVRP